MLRLLALFGLLALLLQAGKGFCELSKGPGEHAWNRLGLRQRGMKGKVMQGAGVEGSCMQGARAKDSYVLQAAMCTAVRKDKNIADCRLHTMSCMSFTSALPFFSFFPCTPHEYTHRFCFRQPIQMLP